MKKVFAICLYLGSMNFGVCQTEKIDNGYNLESYCSLPECKYFKFDNDILFPQGEGTDWRMTNAEVAFKNTGSFLLTGDVDVEGDEMGVRLRLEIEFFDAKDNIIHTVSTDLIEYYSDPNYAEPIVINGSAPLEVAQMMSYLSFVVLESENVPYYELETDCYGPCNNFQLNASIKAFRKSK